MSISYNYSLKLAKRPNVIVGSTSNPTGGGLPRNWKYATQSDSDPVSVNVDSFGNGPVLSRYNCS